MAPMKKTMKRLSEEPENHSPKRAQNNTLLEEDETPSPNELASFKHVNLRRAPTPRHPSTRKGPFMPNHHGRGLDIAPISQVPANLKQGEMTLNNLHIIQNVPQQNHNLGPSERVIFRKANRSPPPIQRSYRQPPIGFPNEPPKFHGPPSSPVSSNLKRNQSVFDSTSSREKQSTAVSLAKLEKATREYGDSDVKLVAIKLEIEATKAKAASYKTAQANEEHRALNHLEQSKRKSRDPDIKTRAKLRELELRKIKLESELKTRALINFKAKVQTAALATISTLESLREEGSPRFHQCDLDLLTVVAADHIRGLWPDIRGLLRLEDRENGVGNEIDDESGSEIDGDDDGDELGDSDHEM